MLRRSLRATSPFRRPGSAAADLPGTPSTEDPSGPATEPFTAGVDAGETTLADAVPTAAPQDHPGRGLTAPGTAWVPVLAADPGAVPTGPATGTLSVPVDASPALDLDAAPSVPDLVDVAQVGTGPLRLDITRRAQHQRRVPGGRPGRTRPRITLVAVGMSTAAVGVLAIGIVQGIRADRDGSAVRDQAAMLALAPSPSVSLPDGRTEDVAANRANAAAAAQAARERAQAQAAAAAAAKRAAQQRAAQQAAAAAAAAQARQQAAAQAARSATRSAAPVPSGSPQAIAQAMLAARGWSGQFTCLNSLWQRESGWDYTATNPSSGAYGIPQALPGSKMASAGSDWRTNPATQIRWGLSYIASTYGTPCAAWAHSQSTGWY